MCPGSARELACLGKWLGFQQAPTQGVPFAPISARRQAERASERRGGSPSRAIPAPPRPIGASPLSAAARREPFCGQLRAARLLKGEERRVALDGMGGGGGAGLVTRSSVPTVGRLGWWWRGLGMGRGGCRGLRWMSLPSGPAPLAASERSCCTCLGAGESSSELPALEPVAPAAGKKASPPLLPRLGSRMLSGHSGPVATQSGRPAGETC